jgi:hypothetical protein
MSASRRHDHAAGQVFTIAVTSAGFESLYKFKPTFEVNSDTDPAVPNLTKYEAWAPGRSR